MKTLFIIVFLFLFNNAIYPQDNSSPSKSLNDFSFDIYREIIKQENSNVLLSPYSLYSVMAQMYIASSNRTKQELSETFHFSSDINQFLHDYLQLSESVLVESNNPSIDLSVSNSLLVDSSLQLRADYLNNIKSYFKDEILRKDFSNPGELVVEVNEWVKQNTRGKILKILDIKDISDDTKILLLSAIYFKDTWSSEFKKENTKNDYFFLNNEKKLLVKMMQNTTNYGYASYSNFSAIELPYNTDNFVFLVILPKEIEGLKDIEEDLNELNLNSVLSDIKYQRIVLKIPRFKFDYEIYELRKILQDMGVDYAFSKEKADFRNMYDNPLQNLYIDDIKHKAFIELNEKGTEAAAVTGVTGKILISIPPHPITIRIDHPFLFFIIEKKTNSIFFMGRYSNPQY